MKLVTVSSKTVLASLKDDTDFQACFVTNSSKQLYQLPVRFIDPEDLRVEVSSPAGRAAPIDANASWDLSFRDKKGAYQAPVRRVLTRESSIVFFLESYLFFLARRDKIRLPADSRNPTEILFSYQGAKHRGFLVDFNLEGIGVFLDQEVDLEVDGEILNGDFSLRSHKISFNSARIAHLAYTQKGIRVGLQFKEMDDTQLSRVKEAFDTWILSQKTAFPNRDEA